MVPVIRGYVDESIMWWDFPMFANNLSSEKDKVMGEGHMNQVTEQVVTRLQHLHWKGFCQP